MKKITMITALITILVVSNVSSQNVGFKFGANFSEMKGLKRVKGRTGFHLGVVADITLLKEMLYFQSSVLYSEKGTKNSNEWGYSIQAKYVELPLMLLYKFKLVGDLKLQVLAGPYFAFGIGGRTTKWYEDYERREEFETFGGANVDMQRLDFGLSGGLGLEFNHFILSTSYDYGMVDTEAGRFIDYYGSSKHRNIKLSLTYLL